MTLDQHKAFCLPPVQTWDYMAGTPFFNNVFQGLSSSQQGVEELVTMPENGDVGVRPCVFDVKGYKLSNMVDSFSKLKKLKIDLTSASTNYNPDKAAWNTARPANILKEANKVGVLMIIAETNQSDIFHRRRQDGYERSTFYAVLNGCTFPDLESLYLANFTADGQAIIDFLERHPKLVNLVIDGFLLYSGSWLAIAEYLRVRRDHSQRLTNVTLNNLYYGLPVLPWAPRFQHWVRCSLPMPFVSIILTADCAIV